MTRSPKWSLPFKFSHKLYFIFCISPYTPCAVLTSSPWSANPNNICQTAQITKLFFIEFSSSSVFHLHTMEAPFNVPQFKVSPLLTFNVNVPLLYKHLIGDTMGHLRNGNWWWWGEQKCLQNSIPKHHFVPHKSIQNNQEQNPGLYSEKVTTSHLT
jgi:hypothetical protein